MIRASAAITFLTLFVGCGQSPSLPSPVMFNVAGTWVLQHPSEASQTMMLLEQTGTGVTGTWSQTVRSLVTNGFVSGSVSRDQLSISAELVTQNGISQPCVTLVRGVLAISEDSLAGVLSSVRQPPCSGRPALLTYTFRKTTH